MFSFPKLDPKMMEAASQGMQRLPQDITGMRTDIETMTAAIEAMNERQKLRDALTQPLPQFVDLTTSQPSFVTSQALKIMRGFISSAGPQTFAFHIGESAAPLLTFWYTQGVELFLPCEEAYPVPVMRGTRIWIEELGGATDFHCKLIAIPG